MTLSIQHQESYSRGELLLRTIFGAIYIFVPHVFLLAFVGIWAGILGFLAFWVVLFTGSYPQSWFEFQVKLMNWSMRFNATIMHLVDGYPAFGVNGTSDKVSLTVSYPETISRGLVIVRTLFGAIYVVLPHGVCLMFRMMATGVLAILAWFSVLFTGNYPDRWHAFNVGTLRWGLRVQLYMTFLTDEYPKFTGKELEEEDAAPVAEAEAPAADDTAPARDDASPATDDATPASDDAGSEEKPEGE